MGNTSRTLEKEETRARKQATDTGIESAQLLVNKTSGGPEQYNKQITHPSFSPSSPLPLPLPHVLSRVLSFLVVWMAVAASLARLSMRLAKSSSTLVISEWNFA